MPDYSKDPFYIRYAEDRRAAELAAEVTVPVVVVSDGPGTPDGAGWFFRQLAGGEVEWRPEGKPFPPPGYRWNIDPADRWANGGHVPADRSQPTVPKLERIRFGPTHPSRPEPVHFDSAKGVRYRS